eukprot:202049_1
MWLQMMLFILAYSHLLAAQQSVSPNSKCIQDPGDVNVPDPLEEYSTINITSYALLPFPALPYDEINEWRTNFDLNTKFISSLHRNGRVQVSKWNNALVKFQNVVERDLSSESRGPGSDVNMKDVVEGIQIATSVIGMGIDCLTGNFGGCISGFGSIFGFLDDSVEEDPHEDDWPILFKNQKAMNANQQLLLEGVVNIQNMVEENKIYLQEVQEMIQQLSNQMKWTNLYNEVQRDFIYIENIYSCFLSIIDTTGVIVGSSCCANGTNRELCKQQFAKSILSTDHTPSLVQSHKYLFSAATGSQCYGGIESLDNNLLFNWAKLSWEHNLPASSGAWNEYDSNWLTQYQKVANRIAEFLFKSSRCLVWASATRDGALSEQAKKEWMDRAKDLISYSSYVHGYIPEIIRNIYQPQTISFNTTCTETEPGTRIYNCENTTSNTYFEKYLEAKIDSMSRFCGRNHFYLHSYDQAAGQPVYPGSYNTQNKEPFSALDYQLVSFTPNSKYLSMKVGDSNVGFDWNKEALFPVSEDISIANFGLLLP